MNYKIEHLNNGETIVNASVDNILFIDIILSDENGDKFGLNFPVDVESVKINGKSVAESATEYLKQFEC